jgi:hypothetical protein
VRTSTITDDTLQTTCHVNSNFMDTSRTKSRLDSESVQSTTNNRINQGKQEDGGSVHTLIWTWPSTLADSIGMVTCILAPNEGQTARAIRHDADGSEVLSWMKYGQRRDINVKGHHENIAIQWAKHCKMTITRPRSQANKYGICRN